MKQWIALVVSFGSLGSFASAATPNFKLDARDVIRIEIGAESEDNSPQSNANLRRRVHRLEQALRQLQDQLFRLEDAHAHSAVAPQKEHTCYIKTSFRGTVYGKGGSEAEARAKAMQSCDSVQGGFSCEDSNVKCGS